MGESEPLTKSGQPFGFASRGLPILSRKGSGKGGGMTVEAKIIKPTEMSVGRLPRIGDVIQDFAFAQADEFINAGQSTSEAGSIVAALLIEAAWMVAGAGVLADGRDPDPDNFRAAVEAMLVRVRFKGADEVSG